MRILFAGTPEFAAIALAALIEAGHEIALVLTQPDRPAGRGQKRQSSPVKRLAQAHGLAVYQPERLREPASWEPIAAAGGEAMVVAAYGLILPAGVLALPARGCLNIHASLLPRWRGAAPIARAIEAGDATTGITIMQMDAGLDTGPILLQKAIPIAADETAGSLHDKLADLGARAIVEALAQLDRLSPIPQPSVGVSYAPKIDKRETVLDWREPASQLERKLRAFDPVPGCTSELAGQTLKLWRGHVVAGAGKPGEILAVSERGIVVACGEEALAIDELQKAGGRRLASADFLRGHALEIGMRFALPA
ncbi:MAG: methionyl-tRNA formyltransferase [Rhodocyclaceae bacterium]|nr:methionyl-tRNA formyltransferase [Rhodocyclaceae bacterium]